MSTHMYIHMCVYTYLYIHSSLSLSLYIYMYVSYPPRCIMSYRVIILGATDRLSLNQHLIWKTRTPPRIWGAVGHACEHDDSISTI